MKRFLLLVVGLLCAVTMFAKDDVSLEQGSVKELKGSKAKVFVKWDYTNSTIEKKAVGEFLKEKGEEWIRDDDKELKVAEAAFLAAVDDEAGKHITVMIDSESECEYVMVIKVSNFNYGNTQTMFMVGHGAGDARLWGKVEIYRKGESEPMAVIDVDGVHAGGFGNEMRRATCYGQLGLSVGEIIKKGK